MKKTVWPSDVNGSLQAPPSKSAAQRAVILASLAQGESEIADAGSSDDLRATIGACRALGATIEQRDNLLLVTGGTGPPREPLHCGESGLCARIMPCIAALFDREVTITGERSLATRPMHTVESSLAALGVRCRSTGGKLPLYVRGPLRGGHAIIDGSLSSQVVTGILLAAPLALSDVYLRVVNLQSAPYVDLTTETMAQFGGEVERTHTSSFRIPAPRKYTACSYRTEGDWSGAAFFLVAGAVAGRVRVSGLNLRSAQADINILEALRQAGATILQGDEWVEVSRNTLRAFSFDATQSPDLFPPLAVLAAGCKGESSIRGVHRLRAKESDRAESIAELLRQTGIRIRTEGDTMHINGQQAQKAKVHAYGDHRIAMAASILALNSNGPVTIEGADSVAKSYPLFFEDLEKITVQ